MTSIVDLLAGLWPAALPPLLTCSRLLLIFALMAAACSADDQDLGSAPVATSGASAVPAPTTQPPSTATTTTTIAEVTSAPAPTIVAVTTSTTIDAFTIQQVEIRSRPGSSGSQLGDLYLPRDPASAAAVVLFHGQAANKAVVADLAKAMAMLAALAPQRFEGCDAASLAEVFAYVGLAAAPGAASEGGGLAEQIPNEADTLRTMDAYNYLGANPDLIVRFIHGSVDPQVPIDRVRPFHEALASLGYDTELTQVPKTGHASPIASRSEAGQLALGIIDQLALLARAP